MKSPEMLAAAKPVAGKSRGRARKFETREEEMARRHNSSLPYFRLQDSRCRQFLELAASREEFEGLKLLFPLVRENSLLGVCRGVDNLAIWMPLAFLAGHDLGRAHPELVEEVLPGLELREAQSRLGIIQNCSGEAHLTGGGLKRACEGIVQANWANVPKDAAEAVLLEVTVKSLRTGFAAATVAQHDPVRCEFVGDIPRRTGNGFSDIVNRLVVGAPLSAFGKPVLALLEHPLLRMARELYPGQPAECGTMLTFLRSRLRALKVRSESECPASELDLVEWVAAGMEYGRRLKEEHPEAVEKIFEDIGGEGLEATVELVRKVVAEAGGTEPVQLLGPLKRWQKRVYRWSEPTCYGEELARVVYFADFAVWIPWALERPCVRGQGSAVQGTSNLDGFVA